MKIGDMEILYEDRDLMVVRKPAGVAAESARPWEKDIVSEVRTLLTQRAARPGKVSSPQTPGQQRKTSRPQVSGEPRKTGQSQTPSESRKAGQPPFVSLVHRLDQPVEGILLLALNRKAAAALSRDMAAGRMEKEYLALSRIRVPLSDSAPGAEFRLTDYLIRDGRVNMSRVADPSEAGAKKSELICRILRTDRDTALLSVRLLTGRHHQIRVQLSHAGLPIIGDRKYGDPCWPVLCLTAARLVFRHPADGRRMEFRLPEESVLTKYPGADKINI